MKVTKLTKKDYVNIAELVDHPSYWKSIKMLLAVRQMDLAQTAAMQQDMEGLRKLQGQIEESKRYHDEVVAIHKNHRDSRPD